MIFVDTSVWIAALRNGAGNESQALRSLLDCEQVALAAPVRIEILSGASAADRPRLRRVLSALPHYLPEPADWTRIDSWLDVAGAAGEPFGFADLLIAAIAVGRGGSVWTLDDDFVRMERLGLVSRHLP